jgi:peptidoglycan/LPS O-acetylase OafA/YrhL
MSVGYFKRFWNMANLTTNLTVEQKSDEVRDPKTHSTFAFDARLSGLRGLAAFGVIFVHLNSFDSLNQPLIAQMANSGVFVFLMLSIYLLLNRLDARPSLKHYFKRRIIRIWPIYYGSIIVFYFVFHIPFWDFVRYLFFVEYYVNPFGVYPAFVFWTLQLEELMYIFIPIIHNSARKVQIAGIFTTLSLAYPFLLTAVQNAGYKIPIPHLELLPPTFLVFYGFGILAYIGKMRKDWRYLAPIGIFIYGASVIYLPIFFPSSPYVVDALQDLCLFPFLLGMGSVIKYPPNFLKWFVFLGEESYALYATHVVFVGELAPLGAAFAPVAVACAVAFAFVVEFALRPREIWRRLSRTYGESRQLRTQAIS